MNITKKPDGLYLSVQTNAGLSTSINLSKVFSSTSPTGQILLTWAEEQILHQLRSQLKSKKDVTVNSDLLAEISIALGRYVDTLCNCHRCKDIANLRAKVNAEIVKQHPTTKLLSNATDAKKELDKQLTKLIQDFNETYPTLYVENIRLDGMRDGLRRKYLTYATAEIVVQAN